MYTFARQGPWSVSMVRALRTKGIDEKWSNTMLEILYKGLYRCIRAYTVTEKTKRLLDAGVHHGVQYF